MGSCYFSFTWTVNTPEHEYRESIKTCSNRIKFMLTTRQKNVFLEKPNLDMQRQRFQFWPCMTPVWPVCFSLKNDLLTPVLAHCGVSGEDEINDINVQQTSLSPTNPPSKVQATFTALTSLCLSARDTEEHSLETNLSDTVQGFLFVFPSDSI